MGGGDVRSRAAGTVILEFGLWLCSGSAEERFHRISPVCGKAVGFRMPKLFWASDRCRSRSWGVSGPLRSSLRRNPEVIVRKMPSLSRLVHGTAPSPAHGIGRVQETVRRIVRQPKNGQVGRLMSYFFSLSRSRISESSSMSGAGAGGAAGASSFLRSSLLNSLMNRKMENAMMRKSKVVCRNVP